MKQKGILIIGVLAIIAIVGSVIFAYTRNNVAVETMAELTITQEQLDSMTAQYNDIQTQLEEAQEEVESLKNSNEQKQNEIDSLTDQNTELQENLTSLQTDLEEEKAKAKAEVVDTEKVEEVKKEETTTPQQTTETASTTQSTASNQNVDTAAQERMLQKAAENGFSISNGDTNIVEAGTNDMSNSPSDVGRWE